VLGHQSDDDPARARHLIAPDGTKFDAQSPGFEEALMNVSADSLNALKRPGRRLVIIEPPRLARNFFDPTTCLSNGKNPKDCAYQANRQPTPLELFYRKQARQPDITSLDLDRVECPRWPTCDAVIQNIIVKRDTVHLTGTYAQAVWSKVDAELHEQHVLPAG
jgi:hypothetical protein